MVPNRIGRQVKAHGWIPEPRALGFVVALGIAVPSVSHASPTFTPLCYTDHLTPAIGVADFNHDGRLDLVVTPAQEDFPFFGLVNDLEVFLGNGDGSFGSPQTINSGQAVFDILAGDVNGDGDADIATANFGNPVISVHLGRGDGTFKGKSNFGAGKLGNGLAMGDLNGDGKPDLAESHGSDPDVAVLLGVGNGAFKDRVFYPTAAPTRAVAIADLNGDNKADLVTANGGPGSLSILFGNGDGTFQTHVDIDLPEATGRSVAAADFDEDGKLDLVVCTQGEGDSGVLILHGNGDGSFAAPVYYPLAFGDFSSTLKLAVGDLDGDDHLDIVASNRLALTVAILLGDGDGSFASGGSFPVDFGLGIAIADVNGDLHPDVIADNCVFLNTGSASQASRVSTAAQEAVPELRGIGLAPNPIRETGDLRFSLTHAGRVTIHVYDIRGRRMGTLWDGWSEAGAHRVPVNRTRLGLTSGAYFYRIQSVSGTASGRFVVIGD